MATQAKMEAIPIWSLDPFYIRFVVSDRQPIITTAQDYAKAQNITWAKKGWGSCDLVREEELDRPLTKKNPGDPEKLGDTLFGVVDPNSPFFSAPDGHVLTPSGNVLRLETSGTPPTCFNDKYESAFNVIVQGSEMVISLSNAEKRREWLFTMRPEWQFTGGRADGKSILATLAEEVAQEALVTQGCLRYKSHLVVEFAPGKKSLYVLWTVTEPLQYEESNAPVHSMMAEAHFWQFADNGNKNHRPLCPRPVDSGSPFSFPVNTSQGSPLLQLPSEHPDDGTPIDDLGKNGVFAADSEVTQWVRQCLAGDAVEDLSESQC
jgi:hypothetical protein